MIANTLLLGLLSAATSRAADAPVTSLAAVTTDRDTKNDIMAIPPAMQEAMVGVTWHEGCPVALADLRLVTVPYIDAQGADQIGQLIIHSSHAESVYSVFLHLHALKFVIQRIEPAHIHGGDDNKLMRDNITSAFNCRPIAGTDTYSEHSWGHALDLNPLWNPWVRGEKVLPPEGAPFVQRDATRPGTIVAGGVAVEAFRAIGWGWGGNWARTKDYQHFSATGR